MTQRETLWPAFLLFAALAWMSVYVAQVDPAPFPKWLQIICNGALLIEIGRRVWRGRFEA